MSAEVSPAVDEDLVDQRELDSAMAAEMRSPGYRLTAWQMEILEFERAHWASPGRRSNAILERFGHNLTRHTQIVLNLIRIPAAAAYDPQLVTRLCDQVDRRAAARRAGAS